MANNIMLRFPEGKPKALTLSYDDGVEQDIRLLSIMKQYGLKGTFNLNSGLYAPEDKVYAPGTIHRRMTKAKVTEVFRDSGMEVAVHGYTHPFLEEMPVERVTYEVLKDRLTLEEQFGGIIRGMAYPFGTYSDRVVEALRNCGIVYARTTVSTEKFLLPKDWLRMPATCHHNNPRLMELAEKFFHPGEDIVAHGSFEIQQSSFNIVKDSIIAEVFFANGSQGVSLDAEGKVWELRIVSLSDGLPEL